jgi:hypothetical protein
MRATLVSQLCSSVAFSFEPEGLIYISNNSYITGSNLRLCYARLSGQYEKLYTLEESRSTLVFIQEHRNNWMSLSKQPELTTRKIDVLKRMVITEKSGLEIKMELKRIKKDQVYFMLHYCSVMPR